MWLNQTLLGGMVAKMPGFRAPGAWRLAGAYCLASVLFACSSSGPGGSSTPPALGGQFTTPSAGAFAWLTFDDTHYSLGRPSPCDPTGANACMESGTFSVSSTEDSLVLTNGATGQTTTLPFHVDATESTSTAQDLKALSGGSLLGDGGGGLTDGGTSLYAPSGPLVHSFRVGAGSGQTFERKVCATDSDCSSIGSGFRCHNLSDTQLDQNRAKALGQSHVCELGCQTTSTCAALGAGYICAPDTQFCASECRVEASCPITQGVDSNGQSWTVGACLPTYACDRIGQVCLGPSDCSPGETCNESLPIPVCNPSAGCHIDFECNGGLHEDTICGAGGQCVSGCRTDANCLNFVERCDLSAGSPGRCVASR